MTQIANLLLLAPQVQETLLLLAPDGPHREMVTERMLWPSTVQTEWTEQRRTFYGQDTALLDHSQLGHC